MPDIAALKHHADLLDRAATRVGVDLQEAALSGRLAFDDIADSVLRCSKCALPEACQVWLSEPAEVGDTLPGYCANHEVITALQENVK
ncbi:DUF6455 family protein [Shimia sp. SDUM112013]|uniref:DUF6455 family protein n=1 Tax=Shimia sp. SDUM112013 TaxID=3136160 RepID=UPI0032EC840C